MSCALRAIGPYREETARLAPRHYRVVRLLPEEGGDEEAAHRAAQEAAEQRKEDEEDVDEVLAEGFGDATVGTKIQGMRTSMMMSMMMMTSSLIQMMT